VGVVLDLVSDVEGVVDAKVVHAVEILRVGVEGVVDAEVVHVVELARVGLVFFSAYLN
jgi:hypothetical protein